MMYNQVKQIILAVSVMTAAMSLPVQAADDKGFAECTLVLDGATLQVLQRDGSCDKRYAPASTFKVPLAVIGFDKDILKSPHEPLWQWKPDFKAPKRDQKAVDPEIWLKDSVLWYSREITHRLGQKQFAQAIAQLDYGNHDVSGTAGKHDGLTASWLGSSLEISADEQAQFIAKLVAETLPVSKAAQAKTKASMPVFTSDTGWKVTGKTGSIWLRDTKGNYNRNRPLAWFVGWAEKDGRTVIFAKMKVYNKPVKIAAGWLLRGQFLKTFDPKI